MLKVFSNKLAYWLVKSKVISVKEFELYSYAVYLLLFTMLPLIVFVSVLFILGNGIEALIFVCALLAMRRYTGGYHASKPKTCLCVTSFILSVGIIFVKCLSNDYRVWIAISCAAVIIWVVSPIDSKEFQISGQKKKRYKLYARVTLLVESLLYTCFTLYQYDGLAMCFAIGIIISAMLLLVSIPKRYRGRILELSQNV